MKLMEAIARIDELKHNTYTREDKLRWLSNLDGMVKHQVLDTHAGGEGVSFTGYNENTPSDTVLLVPAPYDELYLWWLSAQIDFYNGEFARYNNSIALFNTGYSVYKELYHRNNTPLGSGTGFY
jgi:hypothetical protein